MSLPFRIERTRNRSSRAIIAGDSILIRLARGLSVLEEQKHIETLLRRISKSFVRNQSRTLIDPFRSLINGETSLDVHFTHGEETHFRVMDGGKTGARRMKDGWAITRSSKTDERTFHRFLWRLLSVSSLPNVERLVSVINQETLRVPISNISLRLMSSQWGSCSSRGRIALSTPLLGTTPELLRYVIIHELAHVLHRNHSKRFWALVEEYVPGFRNERKKLRSFRLPPLG